MILTLSLDFIVIALLIATIAYAVVLNKRLQKLDASKDELKIFLETFAHSLDQAKMGVDHLKNVSYETTKELQNSIKESRSLRDELSFFIDSGEKTISKLEKLLLTSKTKQKQTDSKVSDLSSKFATEMTTDPILPASMTSHPMKKAVNADVMELVNEKPKSKLLKALKGVR